MNVKFLGVQMAREGEIARLLRLAGARSCQLCMFPSQVRGQRGHVSILGLGTEAESAELLKRITDEANNIPFS